MKILLLGATGMAGHVIGLHLKSRGFNVDTLSRNSKIIQPTFTLDLFNLDELKQIINSNDYEIVINCTGILVKESSLHNDEAIYINSFLPKYLESFFLKTKTRIIHISSDGVFSGKNPPYKEDSTYDGESFYSKTKALGEINNQKDLTIRTSIIGPDLLSSSDSFFSWFFKQHGVVHGFSNSFWNGTSTIQLAKIIEESIKTNVSGILHVNSDKIISKYHLLKIFKDVFKKSDTKILETNGSSQNAMITNTRKDFTYKILDHSAMVEEISEWIKSHKDIYPHYEQ